MLLLFVPIAPGESGEITSYPPLPPRPTASAGPGRQIPVIYKNFMKIVATHFTREISFEILATLSVCTWCSVLADPTG